MATEIHGPKYVIEMEGNVLERNVTEDILGVSFESVDFGTAIVEITISNALDQNGFLRYIDSKIFAEGNTVQLSMGYGTELDFIGEFFLLDHLPSFSPAFPQLQIRAYDPLFKMMLDGRQGKNWHNNLTIEDVVSEINTLGGYEFNILQTPFMVDNKITEGGQGGDVQVVGESYFDFLRKFAENKNFLFYLEQTQAGSPQLMYGRREEIQDLLTYDKRTFAYNSFDDGSLISFSPNYSTNYTPTKLIVVDRNKKRGTTFYTIFENSDTGPLTVFRGSSGNQRIQDAITSAASIRNTLGLPMVEYVSHKKFNNEREALDFGEQWFEQRSDSFITGTATVLGTLGLRGNQIHELDGIGTRLSGDYYFASVKHGMQGEDDYLCECEVQKVSN